MGWLHGTAEKEKSPRVEMLSDDDPFMQMPDVEEAEYILQLWHDVGKCNSSGMGLEPINWRDISAYSEFNSITSIEASAVIKMSRAYVNGVHDKSKEPPLLKSLSHEESKQVMRDRVASQWRAMKANKKPST